MIGTLKHWRDIGCAILIAGAALAVYWPSLQNEFVWDDTALVVRDPLIRSWRLIPEGFRHFLFIDATASDFYRPLQRLTYTLDYAGAGLAPMRYHLTNIVIHAAAAVALFAFARRLLLFMNVLSPAAAPLLAGAAALIWAIHPIHTSAVAYVAGRADPLAALFGFCGLWLGLRSLDSRRAWLWQIGAAMSFLAAMLSKESGVAAAAVWLLILLFLRRKTDLWRWLSAGVIIVAVYSFLRFTAERTPPPRGQSSAVILRPILAARAFAEYAGLLVAPVNLHMERDVSTRFRGDFQLTMNEARFREYQTLLGLGLMISFGFWWRRACVTAPIACLCLGAFVIGYVPVSNLFSLNATVAEHWLYFPSAFLFMAVAVTATRAAGLFPRSAFRAPRSIAVAVTGARATGKARPILRRSLMIVFGGWLVFLAVRTWIRNGDWRDQETFLRRTIADGGDTPRMQVNLGLLLSSRGDHVNALRHLRAAVQRDPDQPHALLGLATAAIRAGEYAEAHAQLEKAQTIPFIRAQALEALAVLDHREHGRPGTELLREAADLEPRNWQLQKRYLLHLEERGETVEALRRLEKILATDWFRAESWHLLGDLLLKISRHDLALRAFEQAAAYDTRDSVARDKIAAIRSGGGR